jgi:hypothetical protein
MAKAKCLVCGAQLDTAMAHRVEIIVNKRTGEKELKYRYCCSEAEYLAEQERKRKYKEDKDKVYYLICDMFGYEIQNTKLFDEWAIWNKLKSNEIIYKYLRENETYLQQICDRPYNNEYQKIRYFSAVLKNSLHDYQPRVEVVKTQPVVIEEHYETKYKAKGRQALEDFEVDDDDE